MIIVGGATATGKSALAEKIALSIGGETVSADSMQIYRGMDIGTAKDTSSSVKLHLIDVVSPETPFTVELMSELRQELKERGAEYMHSKLAALDPVTAKKVHYNNTVRVIRALYVVLNTGRPVSAQSAELKPTEPFKFFILTEERAALREKIAERVGAMFAAGLEGEVRALIERGCDFSMQSMQAIGYKEWAGYFEKKVTLDEVREKIIINTRAYAKRQETWFNNRYKKFAVRISAADFRADPDAVLELVKNIPYVYGEI